MHIRYSNIKRMLIFASGNSSTQHLNNKIMKISVFTFHVDSIKEREFKKLVGDYFKTYYPDAEHQGTLTLTNHRLVVATYDFDWMWSQVSTFVDGVLRAASYNNILVVCESVSF